MVEASSERSVGRSSQHKVPVEQVLLDRVSFKIVGRVRLLIVTFTQVSAAAKDGKGSLGGLTSFFNSLRILRIAGLFVLSCEDILPSCRKPAETPHSLISFVPIFQRSCQSMVQSTKFTAVDRGERKRCQAKLSENVVLYHSMTST